MAQKMRRHCFYCGAPLGIYVEYDQLDTCGKQECEREARYFRETERAEAHEQLDRDRGWN